MVLSVAPGKILFAGEFAGLFDLPIVTCSVNLYTKVTAKQIPEKSVCLSTTFNSLVENTSVESVIDDWRLARNVFNDFEKSNNYALLTKFRTGINPPKLAIGAVLNEAVYDAGIKLDVVTDLPIGNGLGSSASMCVAVVGGVSSVLNLNWGVEKVNEIAYKVEQVLNGKPSGGDNTAVTYGGWQIFARGRRIEEINIGLQKNNWWLIDGGEPAESSLEIFKIVTTMLNSDIEWGNAIREKYQAHVKQVIEEARKGQILAESLSEEQRINELLGIVGEKGRKIVAAIEEIGGHARMCGAGGIKSGAGAILAYSESRDKIDGVCKALGLNYKNIILGGSGWYLEK